MDSNPECCLSRRALELGPPIPQINSAAHASRVPMTSDDDFCPFAAVFRIHTRIRIRMFLGLSDPDPLVIS